MVLGDEHGKGRAQRNADEEVGLHRLGRVEGQLDLGVLQRNDLPTVRAGDAAFSMRTTPSLEVATDASCWIDYR